MASCLKRAQHLWIGVVRRVDRYVVGLSLLAALALLVTPLGAVATAQAAHAAPDPAPALKVQGNQLVDTNTGLPIQLHGVDRSGTEYQCVHGVGIFDPTSLDSLDPTVIDASIQAIKSWTINAVRVPLNEDCWLGINRVNPAYSGTNYQHAIATYVNHLNANGLVAVLDLHWSAPGKKQATGQQPIPDRDHSIDFWKSVAAPPTPSAPNSFGNNASVVFDLFNEPYPDSNQDTTAAWQCWQSGGICSGVHFQAAGMQELVNAVRNAGASSVILLGGVQFANALSQWLTYEPTDTASNLAASWHAYDFNPCNTLTCWNQTVAPVAARVPVVTGEFGEKNQGPQFVWCTTNCPTATGTGLLPWLDSQGISYTGWTWDAWNSWDSLITDYNGTPNGLTFSGVVAYGITYCSYLAAHTTVPWPGPAVCLTP